ncbi:MAG: AbrB/MazE/SpoVT family DNA-binding domain-containing protein [Euryarchaeota archaeon]|nr:AbrB/MazE/SpoVT family DNA-binding domain-containing protein [Euryarchaeota archaeon]
MADTIVVDRHGRVYLPKLIRRLLGLGPNSLMEIDVSDDQVILKRVDSIADGGRGMFKKAKLDVAARLDEVRAQGYPVE